MQCQVRERENMGEALQACGENCQYRTGATLSGEILLELAPKASRVAMLWNDANTGMVLRSREAQDAATKLGVAIKSG